MTEGLTGLLSRQPVATESLERGRIQKIQVKQTTYYIAIRPFHCISRQFIGVVLYGLQNLQHISSLCPYWVLVWRRDHRAQWALESVHLFYSNDRLMWKL